MELASVLHMNVGDGEKSYARNSFIQRKALFISKAIKEEAIHKLYENSGRTTKNVTIADLGNDFNTIFKTLLGFQETLKEEMKGIGHCFVYVVPGSFYGRLFPNDSLDFVHSSFSVHWLSKIPPHIETSNKGNIYISSTSSTEVVSGYYYQFRSDFLKFLTYRSDEIVNGGWMVLTLIGRRSDHRSSKECCYILELLATALNQMVSEGLIEEEKMDSFNIPNYYPSPKEIEDIVKDEGSFAIHRLELFEIDWQSDTSLSANIARDNDGDNNEKFPHIDDEKLIDIVSVVRAVMEPLLIDHFGEARTEEAFKRYNRVVADVMAKERNSYISVTVSLYKLE